MATVKQYIKQLSEKEKIIYEIAKEHLKSSFNIEKSNGYLEWLKTNPHPEFDESDQNSD